jgi:hypothetical protein
MFLRLVVSFGVSVLERWTTMPLRRARPFVPGTVTWTSGGHVGEGALAAGEHGGHEAAVADEVGVAEHIDAAVEAVKPALADAAGDHRRAHARAHELHVGDHTVLPRGDPGDQSLGSGAFLSHV